MENNPGPEESKFSNQNGDEKMGDSDSDSDDSDYEEEVTKTAAKTCTKDKNDFVVLSENEKPPRESTIGALKFFNKKP